MTRLRFALLGLLGCIGGAAVAAPAAPAAVDLSALGAIEPGMWQLKHDGAAPQMICVSDPYALMQLRHAAAACSRLVIANESAVATVHYSCPGQGWGRTTVRVSTPRLARIDTQGIADSAPFNFVAEARRTGPCRSAAR